MSHNLNCEACWHLRTLHDEGGCHASNSIDGEYCPCEQKPSAPQEPDLAIQVRPTGPDDIKQAGQVVAAVFRDPATGADVPVTIRLFQLGFGAEGFGVGVYMTDGAGEPQRGTVLRWDDGPEAEPTVIQWQASHCKDDECGSPCGHEAAS